MDFDTLLLVLYRELGVYLGLRALMHLVSAEVNTLVLMSHCPPWLSLDKFLLRLTSKWLWLRDRLGFGILDLESGTRGFYIYCKALRVKMYYNLLP